MKLILMQFLTLDGVSQGPGAPDEDTSGGFTQGGWLVPHMDERFMQIATDWTCRADAFLFGRRTYEAFSEAWPKMDDPADPIASRLNGLPKYVASHGSLPTPWQPAKVLSGDVAAAVRTLKEQPGGELQIHGSTTLGRSMLAAGLVDELRLVVAPVILGDGRRLFTEAGGAAGLRLTHHEATPGGLAIFTYAVEGAPAFGTYGN